MEIISSEYPGGSKTPNFNMDSKNNTSYMEKTKLKGDAQKPGMRNVKSRMH